MQTCNNKAGYWVDMTRELLFAEKNGKNITKTNFNFLFLSPMCCPARKEFIDKFVDFRQIENCDEKELQKINDVNEMRSQFLKLMMKNVEKARAFVEKREEEIKNQGYNVYSAKDRTNDYRGKICCFLSEKACEDTAKMKASDFYEYFMECDSWEDDRVGWVIDLYGNIFRDIYNYSDPETLNKNICLLRSKALEKYNRLRNRCIGFPEPPSFLCEIKDEDEKWNEYAKLILFSLLYDASEKDQYRPLLKMFGVSLPKTVKKSQIPQNILYSISISAFKDINSWNVDKFINFVAYLEDEPRIIENAPEEFLAGVIDCCKSLYNRIGEGEIEGSADEILKIRNRFKGYLDKNE